MKKLISAILLLTLLCAMSVGVFADSSSVTYDGSARKFIFAPGSEYSPTDLFSAFKNVMPGDSITQRITVRNHPDHDVKVKIYLRALGAVEGSEDLLSQLHMTVAKSEDNTMAYMFDATADQTDGLSDWVLLGTLYSGGEVNLELTLDVPITMDDEFQGAAGYLQWQFMVEELPIDPDDPRPPKTGDDSHIGLYIGLAAGSAVLLVILIILMGRKKKNED